MNIVVDSNIIISILIKQDGITAKRFHQLAEHNKLFIHSYTLTELTKHNNKIKKASKLNDTDFNSSKTNILSSFTILETNAIPPSVYQKAFNLVKGIDENDTVFIAVCIYIDGILWTGDKILYYSLKERGVSNIYNSLDIETLLQ